MIGNSPIALESLPCAREILRELDSDDPAPPLYLIRGRSGTGKSILLAAARTRLRHRGLTLTDNPRDALPSAGSESAGAQAADAAAPGGPAAPARPALVLDDVHTLDRTAFELLCTTVESARCPVILAMRPRPHDARLRELADLVARRGRVLDLRALGVAEIAPFARELGMMVPPSLAQHIHNRTAGIHGGVVAALTAACATRLDAGVAAVDDAVAAWARTRLDEADPDLLDTFVVAAIGAGLDTSEITEVLDVSPSAAQALVDRARGSALITDADLLLEPAVPALRTLVGDRRYLAVQRRLLHARLDAGLLREHTALLLAESGVRDPQLAEFLCTTAEKAGDEAVRHYAAASAAGADREAIAVRWADAAARAGDCETALRLAEPVLARADVSPPELAAAVRICAGVWTRRGLTARAAQLYTWLGPHRIGADWAVGATILSLAGDAAGARTLAAFSSHWPPTEATARAALIADALSGTTAAAEIPVRPTDSIPSTSDSSQLPHGSTPDRTSSETPHGAASATRRSAGALPAEPQDDLGPADAGFDRPPGTPAASDIGSRSRSTPGGSGRSVPAAPITRRADRRPDTPGTHWPPTLSMTSDSAPRPASIPDGAGDSLPTTSIPGALASATRRAGPAPGGRGAAVAAAAALIHAAHSGVAPADNGGDRFLPCSAVSIATLLCLSMGDPRRAADALRDGARDPQQRVLGAWVAMLGGNEQAAAEALGGVDLATLAPRDRLLAHGALVGLARRGGDHTALTVAWRAACPLFDEVGADLLALLPIGELWLAGVRLRDEARVLPLVDAALELLRRLGDPPAWANAFHWYAIQAAIAHESPGDLLPHAHRLKTAAAAGDPQAAALADAGRTWVLVLRGEVEREAVEAAVQRLAALGASWDAARLASEAALAADDAATATALLKLARTVRAQSRPPEAPVRPGAPEAPVPRPQPVVDAVLSDREREVAELVLLGLTYREIGARLYISAKTVEHHVARIRRRIGASSRSELLSMLRAMGHGSLLV
ncbi:LuxR C-terminal-related transcriptional regulator [Nocardia sp. NPDC127526]|uniref:LuxR C-terminal-related transcriptional regulator n=1 Tax=Nocardia sp. NPDC127526 TaxID=3345393 RepID=UPI00362C4A17